MSTYLWVAANDHSYTRYPRNARSYLGAIRAARWYIRNELMGDGAASIWLGEERVATTERSIRTGYKFMTYKTGDAS